jgi:hypothetical protein
MIPNGTIEMLEELVELIDRRKDEQDGETYKTRFNPNPRPVKALRPLWFNPPLLVDGLLSEPVLYNWLCELKDAFAENELDEFEANMQVQRSAIVQKREQASLALYNAISALRLSAEGGPIVSRDYDCHGWIRELENGLDDFEAKLRLKRHTLAEQRVLRDEALLDLCNKLSADGRFSAGEGPIVSRDCD